MLWLLLLLLVVAGFGALIPATLIGTRIFWPALAVGGHTTVYISDPLCRIRNRSPGPTPDGTTTSKCSMWLSRGGVSDRLGWRCPGIRRCRRAGLLLWFVPLPVGRAIMMRCPGFAFGGQVTRKRLPFMSTLKAMPGQTFGGTMT